MKEKHIQSISSAARIYTFCDGMIHSKSIAHFRVQRFKYANNNNTITKCINSCAEATSSSHFENEIKSKTKKNTNRPNQEEKNVHELVAEHTLPRSLQFKQSIPFSFTQFSVCVAVESTFYFSSRILKYHAIVSLYVTLLLL